MLYLWHSGKTPQQHKSGRDKLMLPDAHLDPQSEPSFWARRCPSGIWLQLLSHWEDKILNHSLEKHGGFLLLCCRPDPSAELLQQLERSHLSTRERVNTACSLIFPGHYTVKSSRDVVVVVDVLPTSFISTASHYAFTPGETCPPLFLLVYFPIYEVVQVFISVHASE